MEIFLRSAKELVRHIIAKVGGERLLDAFRPKTAVKHNYLRSISRGDRFAAIYANRLWQDVPGVPDSGKGSSLDATESLRTELPAMLDSLDVKTLVDLGCGDFNWMRTLTLNQNYIGIDIVRTVIDKNSRDYADARHSFIFLDAVEAAPPPGDVILCREVLFHLSFNDIRAILRNCGKSTRRYFMATTDNSTLINADIRSGDFRRLNLRRPPFSFPQPDFSIHDDGVEKGRIIGIWKWDAIAPLI